MQYYFDIETTGFKPETDKIVTIQYQQLDMKGRLIGDLVILREWDLGEENIVKEIYGKLILEDNWNFIPIGYNLIFDFNFLFAKFKQYGLKCPTLSEFIYDKPTVDIKHTLIIANELSFKGSGLDKMTNKVSDGKDVPKWYRLQDYERIESYIKQETESFIEVLNKLVTKLPEVIK